MNVPIVQGLLSVGDGKISPAGGKITTESDLSQQKIKLPEAPEDNVLSDNSNLSKEQCDPLQVFYPPFFPLGNTQGIYSVLNLTKTDSSSADSMEKEKADNSINTEAVAARQQEQLALGGDKMINKGNPEAKEMVSLGSVLDLKV